MSAVDISTLGIAVESSGVETASNRLDRLTQEGGKAESATSKLSSSFDNLTRYARLAAEAFAAWKLSELIKDATLLAARVETLGVVMKVVGNNAGYTGKEMEGFLSALKKAGITTQESMSALIKMAGAQMDLAKASQLARVAQDAAVIGGINSSEAFGRMIQGIRSGETEILKTIGIVVNFQKAYEDMGGTLGKNAQDLSELEKVQARTNVVLAYGSNIAGAYESAMGTAGKQMLSMSRYTEELKLQLGQAFTPALSNVITGLTAALKTMNDQFDKNKTSVAALGQELTNPMHLFSDFRDLATGTYQAVYLLVDLLTKSPGGIALLGMAAYGASGGVTALAAAFGTLGATITAAMATNPVGWLTAVGAATYLAARSAVTSIDSITYAYTGLNVTGEAYYKAELARAAKADEAWENAKKKALWAYKEGGIMPSPGLQTEEIKRLEMSRKAKEAQEAADRKKAADKAAEEARELAEKQSRYNQQVLEAEATLRAQYASNQKQREDSALQQRLEALNTEKATGLKTAEEYLNAKYDLEREYMQKELDASNALLEQRYQDYSKISNDPAADRLQQAKAEEAYQKQLGESLKIVEKMNAANREKSHDNEALAQQRINEEVRRANDLYNDQLRVRQQLVRMDNEAAINAANMTGVNPSTGGIDTIADAVAHDLAVQQAAHDHKLQMIQEERDANLESLMEGRRAYEDFIKVRESLDKQVAQENQDHNNKNAAIAQKAYKSQLSMAAQYTGLASQLFGELANAQDQSSRKGFENAKMYSTAAAIMSTAAAVMNALATVQPYPLAVAAAATAAAIGAIQIATIQSTSFGGGGTVPSVPSGSYGGSGSTTAGTGIGAPVKSVAELQTEESLRKLANAAESASLAVSKVADGLTKISQLFETSYSDNLSKGLTGAAAGSASGNFWGASKTAGGWGAGMFGGVMDPSLAAAVNAPIGGALNHMFGWGNKWARTDGGISLGLEDGNLTGQSFNEYRKKGGWFTSGKKRDEYGELDPQILSAMDSYMSRIKSSILIAATSMGTSTDFGKATLQAMNISTAGRKPEDIQKDLEKFFTDAADTLAKTTKGLEKFAFFGENAFDALIRLSTSLQGVNELFELTGKTLVSSTLAGANAAYKLADAFGGLDKMQDSVNEYFKAMFSESEQDALKAAQNQREINAAFKTMGLAVPKTTEEFIKLVNSLDITKEKGAALYKALMDVAPEFADLKKYLEDLSNTAIDNAFAVLQKSVQAEKDTLQKWYSAHSEHLDKLWAKSQEAYKKEEDAARTRLNKVQVAANSIKSAYDNLSVPGSESLMSREYAERMIHAYANSNKIPLNGELDKALKVISQPSQNLFSSEVDYRRDFYRTAADLATLNKRAQGQLSDAEKQLQQLQQNNELAKKAYDDQKKAAKVAYDAQIAALDKTLAKAEEQIKAIRGTTVAVMSVDKALANLTAVIAKQTLATGGDKAAVNELKELRAELRAQNGAMAKYMLKMAKYIEQWEDEGMPKTRTA